MSVNDYSTTAGNNTALFPEGMNPSAVNDGVRAIQADLKAFALEPYWVSIGNDDGDVVATYGASNLFYIPTDQTAEYHEGRRVRVSGSATGTIYGKITSSSYSSPNTTVIILFDSGLMSNEALTVRLGLPVGGLAPAAPISNAVYSTGTVRVHEFHINGVEVGGIDWNGSSLSLVTD